MRMTISEVIGRSRTRLQMDEQNLEKLYAGLRSSNEEATPAAQADVQAKIEKLQSTIARSHEAFELAQKLEASGIADLEIGGVYDEDRENAVRQAAKLLEQTPPQQPQASQESKTQPDFSPADQEGPKAEEKPQPQTVDQAMRERAQMAWIAGYTGALPLPQYGNKGIEEEMTPNGPVIHMYYDGGDKAQHRVSILENGINTQGSITEKSAAAIVMIAVAKRWELSAGSGQPAFKLNKPFTDDEKYQIHRAAKTHYLKQALLAAQVASQKIQEGKVAPPEVIGSLAGLLVAIKQNKTVIVQDAYGERGLCEPDMNKQTAHPTLRAEGYSKKEKKMEGQPVTRAGALNIEINDLRKMLKQEIEKNPELAALVAKAMGVEPEPEPEQAPAITPVAQPQPQEPKKPAYREMAGKLKEAVAGLKNRFDHTHDMKHLVGEEEVATIAPRKAILEKNDFYKEEKTPVVEAPAPKKTTRAAKRMETLAEKALKKDTPEETARKLAEIQKGRKGKAFKPTV